MGNSLGNHDDDEYNLMPGLFDEENDFYGSLTSNLNEPAVCGVQDFSSGILENDFYTAAPSSAPQMDSVQNDIAWHHGSHLLPLTNAEVEAIQRSRAAHQKSLASSPSFAPTPYRDVNVDFNTPGLDFAGSGLNSFRTSGPATSSNEVGVLDEAEVQEPSGAAWAPSRNAPKTSTSYSSTLPIGMGANHITGTPAQNNQPDEYQQQPSSKRDFPSLLNCSRTGCQSTAAFTKTTLKRHLRDVHDDPLVCTIKSCTHKRPFSRRSDFNRHKQSVHSQDREYVCTDSSCGTKFARKDHLAKHMRDTHITYLCPMNHCRRRTRGRFANTEDLAEHLDSKHGTYECAVMACAKAPLSMFTEASLRQHTQSHHGVNDPNQSHVFALLKFSGKEILTEAEFFERAFHLTECKVCGKGPETLPDH